MRVLSESPKIECFLLRLPVLEADVCFQRQFKLVKKVYQWSHLVRLFHLWLKPPEMEVASLVIVGRSITYLQAL